MMNFGTCAVTHRLPKPTRTSGFFWSGSQSKLTKSVTAVTLRTRRARENIALFIKEANGVEVKDISAKGLRVLIHLPDVREDSRALWDEMAFIEVILGAHMRSVK